MNLFNIPRAFGVSGFGGNWNVGMHSFAAAMIAFLWAKLNGFSTEERDHLVALALVHDLHEAATGDILPMFKTPGSGSGGTRRNGICWAPSGYRPTRRSPSISR